MTHRLSLFPLLLCGVLTAQNNSPSGTYGVVTIVSQIDSFGNNGGALLGLITFDGGGNLSGSIIIKPRNTNPANAAPITSAVSGTYTTKPDGTGTMTLDLDIGFSVNLPFVVTDGGKGLLFTGTDGCSPCGADIPLRLVNNSLAGDFPIGLLLQGATGTIPVTLANITKDVGGPTPLVYSASGLTGKGAAKCPDGSDGTWTANIPNLTLVVDNGTGNFLASASGIVCGNVDVETLSGLVYSTAAPGGAVTTILHAVSGGVANGIARAVGGASLNGAYGLQFNSLPFPAGSVGLLSFDGAGKVTLSVTNVGGLLTAPTSGSFPGTYVLNPDGTGTITLTGPNGQRAGVFAFILTDGGSQLLLLRTDANPAFNVATGIARLQ